MATKAPNHHITYDDKFKADLFIDPADLKKAENGERTARTIITNYAYTALAKANPEFARKYRGVDWPKLAYHNIPPQLVMPKTGRHSTELRED